MDRLCDAAVSEMLHYFLIGIFGAMGAVSRAALSNWIKSSTYTLGTLCANLLGCALLGIMTGVGLHSSLIPEHWRIPIAAGFLGSLTTFSTFTLENLKLLEAQQWKLFLLHFILQLLLGLVLAACGLYGSRLLLR